MISHLRKIFGVVAAAIIVSILLASIEFDSREYKYYIKVPNSRDYRTNSYTSNGSCITFKNQDGNNVTLCGNYSIIEKIKK